MLRRLIISLALVLLFPVVSQARPTVERINAVPQLAVFEKYIVQPIQSEDEVIKVEWVEKELNQIITKLPSIEKQNWKIHIIPQRCYDKKLGQLGGIAVADDVYVFASNRASEREAAYVTAHEIGHLVHDTFLYDLELPKYGAWRMKGRKTTHFEEPSELFAEDFRVLYGSDLAKENKYWPSIEKPTWESSFWMWGRIERDTIGWFRRLAKNNKCAESLIATFDRILLEITGV